MGTGASPALEVFVVYLALEVLSMQFRVCGFLRKVRVAPGGLTAFGEPDVLISYQSNFVDALNHVAGELYAKMDGHFLEGPERVAYEVHLTVEAVRFTILKQLLLEDSDCRKSEGPYREGF